MGGETVKVPEGKLLLCFNVYCMLGLDAKYGKIKEYVKKVIVDKTDKQSNHSNFLAALKTWMDEHNQNPDMTRLKDKDAVMKAHTTLTTSKTMGSRLKAPKRLFIFKQDRNEQKYGPLSEQKISERDVFGVKREGIYRLAGEQGHYEVEDFDESALTEQTVEHDGEGPLSKGWRTGAKPFRVHFVMLRLNRKQELPIQSTCLGYGVLSRCASETWFSS